MTAATQHRQPAAAALAPVYRPTPADLDEMHRIQAVHDLLDVAPDLPLSVKLGLLDYAATLLDTPLRETTHA
jgi:hypothetical protein